MTTKDDNSDEALEERLKAALWFAIGKIVDEETLKLGINATPQFIGGLTELAWSQIENVSVDLESFSRHAKRTTIATDDVMLLARRNEGLEEIMKDYLTKIKPTAPAAATASGGKKVKSKGEKEKREDGEGGLGGEGAGGGGCSLGFRRARLGTSRH